MGRSEATRLLQKNRDSLVQLERDVASKQCAAHWDLDEKCYVMSDQRSRSDVDEHARDLRAMIRVLEKRSGGK